MRKITDKELDEIRSYVVSFNLTDASDITGYEIDGEILLYLIKETQKRRKDKKKK